LFINFTRVYDSLHDSRHDYGTSDYGAC